MRHFIVALLMVCAGCAHAETTADNDEPGVGTKILHVVHQFFKGFSEGYNPQSAQKCLYRDPAGNNYIGPCN